MSMGMSCASDVGSTLPPTSDPQLDAVVHEQREGVAELLAADGARRFPDSDFFVITKLSALSIAVPAEPTDPTELRLRLDRVLPRGGRLGDPDRYWARVVCRR
jgi:hypothetical protein